MPLKITVRGNKAVLSGFDDYSKKVQEQLKTELKNWAQNTEQDAKFNSIGEISDSISSESENNGLSWYVYSTLLIAAYTEFGTGARVRIPAGLEAYAKTFFVTGEGTLPASPFLFANARRNFEETVRNIKNLLDKQK